MTLGSGWNIPVDLIIGPHNGISYLTHPQAQPTRVTDFQAIERITTMVLASKDTNMGTSENGNGATNPKTTPPSNTSSPVIQKKADKRSGSISLHNSALTAGTAVASPPCSCHDIKTQLRIKVNGNADDLAITCNGAKTAENIADLVDGYCRIFNNSDVSLWDRTICKF